MIQEIPGNHDDLFGYNRLFIKWMIAGVNNEPQKLSFHKQNGRLDLIENPIGQRIALPAFNEGKELSREKTNEEKLPKAKKTGGLRDNLQDEANWLHPFSLEVDPPSSEDSISYSSEDDFISQISFNSKFSLPLPL
jgi:hypothetical protein